MASCMILTVDCDGKSVTTIEGLQDPITGELDPLQQAFIDWNDKPFGSDEFKSLATELAAKIDGAKKE